MRPDACSRGLAIRSGGRFIALRPPAMFLAGEEPGNAHGLRAPSMPANKKPGP